MNLLVWYPWLARIPSNDNAPMRGFDPRTFDPYAPVVRVQGSQLGAWVTFDEVRRAMHEEPRDLGRVHVFVPGPMR